MSISCCWSCLSQEAPLLLSSGLLALWLLLWIYKWLGPDVVVCDGG